MNNKTIQNILEDGIKVNYLIDKYFDILKDEYWLSKFVNWELNFYKLIGYDIDFNDYVEEVSEGNKTNYKLKN